MRLQKGPLRLFYTVFETPAQNRKRKLSQATPRPIATSSTASSSTTSSSSASSSPSLSLSSSSSIVKSKPPLAPSAAITNITSGTSTPAISNGVNGDKEPKALQPQEVKEAEKEVVKKDGVKKPRLDEESRDKTVVVGDKPCDPPKPITNGLPKMATPPAAATPQASAANTPTPTPIILAQPSPKNTVLRQGINLQNGPLRIPTLGNGIKKMNSSKLDRVVAKLTQVSAPS